MSSLTINMKDYYSHNQDKMSPAQIRELKVKTFPYLSDDDVRLSMSDRNIIKKELDLDIDSLLSGNNKHSIGDVFNSMHECLSTYDKTWCPKYVICVTQTCQPKTVLHQTISNSLIRIKVH